jgi:hypothetical protein
MIKALIATATVATGLLMLDVAQPALTGSTAEAAPPRRVVAVRRAPAFRAAPRANFARPRSNFVKPKTTFRVKTTPKFVHTQQQFKKSTFGQKKFTPQVKKGFNPNINAFKKGPGGGPGAGPGGGGGGLGPKGALKNGPGFGKKLAVNPNLAKASFIKLANKPWPIHKGPHKLWWHGGWKTFVPFTALSVVLVGGAYYWPDAYVSVARPYCSGVTPDGCRLNWQIVGFEGGGSEWQCVQYCARPGVAPPPRAASLVMTPPAPSGGRCELEIFADPKFAGLNAQSDVDQPKLVDAGWKNEISSIQVKAGTWDFFSEDDYAGENMRLAPGPYPDLGPEWTKRIGSFMCVQGG